MSDLDLMVSQQDLEKLNTPDELVLLSAIAERVSHLLVHEPDLLFSYMYRLDIDQDKIEQALIPDYDPAELRLARLILDRQKQRMATKARYKVDPIEGWEY